MQTCVIDFESFYSNIYSLSKMTTEEYVRAPLFETIGFAAKFGNHPTDWIRGDQAAPALAKIDWSDKMVIAQHCAFDGAIMGWRYGIKPAVWVDIMGMSRALFPHEKSHSLAAQAERAGIGTKGDEVIKAIGKRLVDFTPEELHRYGQYCINDVELTYKLFNRYMEMGFPKKELRLLDLTLRMFIEPELVLDKPLLEQHYRAVVESKSAMLEKVRDKLIEGADPDYIQAVFAEGLDGIRKLLMSNDKFAYALEMFGVVPPMKKSPTTGKMTYAFAKTDEAFKALEEHEDPAVQALVAARLSNKTTLEETRTLRFIGVAGRGKLPVALRYAGASTYRWSAEGGLQFQNIPRMSPIKQAIQAPPGYVMCGADLSNIELRLGLWLAEQDDRVQMLADGIDLYKDFAARVYGVPYDEITKTQRQVGKVSNLSLIYGTGAAKLREALRIMGSVVLPVEEVLPIVKAYREMYVKVVAAWRMGDMALHAIHGDQEMDLFRNGICRVEGRRGIRLPSGLHLQYPNLRRLENAETGKAEWVFDSKYGPERAYGAKTFQGVTQAVARCIMADGLLRLQKRYPVKLTVHDSAYWLAREGEEQESLDFGIKAITTPVSYCPGLPLAAEGAFGASLLDC